MWGRLAICGTGEGEVCGRELRCGDGVSVKGTTWLVGGKGGQKAVCWTAACGCRWCESRHVARSLLEAKMCVTELAR